MRENKNPKINPVLSKVGLAFQILSALLLFSIFIMFLTQWAKLPATVATHYNFFGTPDSYGSKSQFFALLIVETALYLLITVIIKFPWIYNTPYEITEKNAPVLYGIMKEMLAVVNFEITASFSYILFAGFMVAKGRMHGLGNIFLIVFLAAVTLTIIFYCVRIRRHKNG